MTPTQEKANRLIQHFAERINNYFTLDNGVCALYDTDGQEAVIIEAPQHSDNVLLYCTLQSMPLEITRESLSKLLMLNFEVSAMQGCWVAMDEDYRLRLCYLYSMVHIDENHFSDTLTGFIEQVKDVRALIPEFIEQAAVS
ncbi:MAG: type III secretion system chaperone [Reinekea sp.]|jgi:hypothetical protein